MCLENRESQRNDYGRRMALQKASLQRETFDLWIGKHIWDQVWETGMNKEKDKREVVRVILIEKENGKPKEKKALRNGQGRTEGIWGGWKD